MKNILYYLVFVFGFVLSSCVPSQDSNGDFLNGVDYSGGTNNGGTGTTTSRLLKKINSHSKNDDTGEWEDTETVFNYSGKKLISCNDGSDVTTFVYNSNNKISKIVNSGQDTTLEYSNGSVSKMTTEIAGGFGTITTTYTYTAGKLSKSVSIQEYSFPMPMKMYIETTFQFAGENMVKLVAHSGIYLPDGSLNMNPLPVILEFTYDTKNSPYKLLPEEFGIYMAGIAPQGAAYLSANSVVSLKTTNDDNTVEMVHYTHTYDSKDYVSTTTGDDGETVKYTYQ